jgi:hypothetical protein
MNTDEGEIPFGGRQHARQREKHLVIIGVYPRSSAPDSLAIPFRFSSFVNCYSAPSATGAGRRPMGQADEDEVA